MKIIQKISMLIFLIVLSANVKAQIGTWDMDAETMLANMTEEDIESIGGQDKLNDLKKELSMVKFGFYKDGKMAIMSQGQVQQLTWELSEDTKMLKIEGQDAFLLSEVNNNKLVLKNIDNQGLLSEFIFKPATSEIELPKEIAKEDYGKEEGLSIGNRAPEIIQADREGNDMKLSSLKGKVVLIDFWAAWCGPCRMENRNLIKTYDHFKDKNFTVFSVSLDQDKNKWFKAIEQDKLAWQYHVSDLKGWSNAASNKYGINSIPSNFLLNEDGVIIGKDLRGDALDKALEEYFASK